MQLYASGNSEAFSILYERFENRIFNFLNNRLSGKQKNLVPDLFQTVWLKVHQARTSFEPTQKFSNWVFTIAINSLRDHVARKQFEMEVELERDDQHHSLQANPEEIMITANEMSHLGKILEELTSLQREALLLMDGEGFSSSETGEMLGISEAAARQLVVRARYQVSKLKRVR